MHEGTAILLTGRATAIIEKKKKKTDECTSASLMQLAMHMHRQLNRQVHGKAPAQPHAQPHAQTSWNVLPCVTPTVTVHIQRCVRQEASLLSGQWCLLVKNYIIFAHWALGDQELFPPCLPPHTSGDILLPPHRYGTATIARYRVRFYCYSNCWYLHGN